MGYFSSLKNDIAGALGNIEHAQLIFLPDPEGAGIVHTSQVAENAANPMDLAKGSLTRASNALSNKAGALENKWAEKKTTGADGKIFNVQFNPSTLQFMAVGGGNSQIMTVGGKDSKGQTSFQALDARIDLSVQLIFDAVNNKDAFAEDKRIAEAANVAKGIATAVNAASGKEYTVLPQIEGLHASMRVRKEARVVLQWGKIAFQGSMTRLNTKYTMFSPVGNPIRAVASITISSIDEEVKNWNLAYDRLFGDQSAVGTKRFGQTLSGLFNL